MTKIRLFTLTTLFLVSVFSISCATCRQQTLPDQLDAVSGATRNNK